MFPGSCHRRCIIGEGAEIYGEVHNSVIGADVRIEKGVVVRDSIIMRHSTIGEGTQVNKAIIAENVHVGKHVVMGVGEEAPNVLKTEYLRIRTCDRWRKGSHSGWR